jgi:mycothiol synthase
MAKPGRSRNIGLTRVGGRPSLVAVPTWTIEEWPLREISDELYGELYAARAELDAEWAPGDPRRPLADEIASIRHMPALEDGVMFLARDASGSVAGMANCGWEQLEGWEHVLWIAVSVLPAQRRQGLGRLLLARSADVARQRGLRTVMGRTRHNVLSGAEFSRRFGAEPGQVGRENRLDLRGVDRDLVDRWIAEGPARAPGYRLEFVDGRTPPDLLERVAEVYNVMNSAPRDDLDFDDTQVTPDLVRQYEEAAAASGHGHWAYYAVEEASGRFVGLTEISIRGIPDRVNVGDTGVDAAHRGKGLGKWLKAAMTRRILAELPDVRWVITWNAGSNDAMLAINNQLGFRQAVVTTAWQIPTSELQARLAAVPAGVPSAAGPAAGSARSLHGGGPAD